MHLRLFYALKNLLTYLHRRLKYTGAHYNDSLHILERIDIRPPDNSPPSRRTVWGMNIRNPTYCIWQSRQQLRTSAIISYLYAEQRIYDSTRLRILGTDRYTWPSATIHQIPRGQ